MNWSSDWNKGVPPVWPKQKQTETTTIKYMVDGSVLVSSKERMLIIPWRKSVVEHKTVAACIIGDLAVHEELEVSEEQWQITHVPTLTNFTALPEGNFSRENLIKWCEQVQLQLLDDWAILRTLTNETYGSDDWKIVAAKSRIYYMCGQIPIKEEE